MRKRKPNRDIPSSIDNFMLQKESKIDSKQKHLILYVLNFKSFEPSFKN